MSTDLPAEPQPPQKKPRGFALLSPERRKEIAAMGGLANADGRHCFTSEQAKTAGRKGGIASGRVRRAKGQQS
jgi:general stress protein YciG